jgi:hypothetical protein
MYFWGQLVQARFFDRRGTSIVIHSAKNFLGANRKLKELYQLFQSNQLQKILQRNITDMSVKCRFIHLRSLHFGGL